MTHETTAPVQSLVDDALNELENLADDLDGTYPGRGDGDGLRRAAELIRQQRKELKAIEAMVGMLEEGEWAEHVGMLCGPIAQRLETEITRLHNEQQAAQAAMPDGWRLVPAKPTDEMIRNAHRQGHACATSWYIAMLSAAPTPPAQQPRNRHGVDAHYFHKKMGLVLRDFESFTPDELARTLARLAKVADESVLLEPEFAAPPAQQSQTASVHDNLLDVAVNGVTEGERLESLARWLDLQNFRPDIMSIAADDLRALYRRAKDAEQAALHFAAPEQAEQQPASYVDDLIDRLNDAQQEINLAANTTMSQALCSASALLDEVEVALRRYTAHPAAEQDAVPVQRETLQRAADRFAKAQIFDFASELRALMNKEGE